MYIIVFSPMRSGLTSKVMLLIGTGFTEPKWHRHIVTAEDLLCLFCQQSCHGTVDKMHVQ